MTEPVYTARNSLADKERTFSLGPEALRWADASGTGEMAYADVRELRLISYASPIGKSFQCTVRSRNGLKIKLRSAHYRSLNNFENRSRTYAPFVRALTQRVASHAPEARFIAGSTGLWAVWLVVGALFAGLLLLLIFSLFEGLPSIGAWVIALAVCVALTPLVVRQVREGAANTFDPDAPPPELLGDADLSRRKV